MQCSKCGFIMSELDPECLRCKRQAEWGGGAALAAPAAPPPAAAEEKECPRCGKATSVSAATCDKCGYEYGADESRAERYQALLAQETQATPPGALRRTLPPELSWGIIGACLLVIGGAGWAMFGGSATGSSAESTMDSPILVSHRHKPSLVGIQNVTYSLTGTAAQAQVTYDNAKGTAEKPATVALPWTQTFKAKAGSHLSLSALPTAPHDTVTASISVNGVVQKQSDTPGADGKTTVEDTL